MEQAHPKESISIVEVRAKRTLRLEYLPVLTYSISRPTFSGLSGLQRIERYYRDMAEAWKSRWEGPLYQQAVAKARQADAAPFQPWNCTLRYTMTLRTDGMLSLYADALERTDSPHELCVRCADTWLLPSGTPCTLSALLGRRWRRLVLERAAQQIRSRLAGFIPTGSVACPVFSLRNGFTVLRRLYVCISLCAPLPLGWKVSPSFLFHFHQKSPPKVSCIFIIFFPFFSCLSRNIAL